MKTTQRTDWKTLPLPANHSTILLDRTYSKEQSELIMAGFLPKEMEDKWFLFFENDTLFCHRSWTGFCIYEIHFVTGGKSLRATRVEVNRDTDQYLNTDNEKEVNLIYSLIQNFLLTRY